MLRTLARTATLFGSAVGLYLFVLRPRMLRWGATEEEARRRLPGDDLWPDDAQGSTMAITIDAPPEELWPWLVQMGARRAGWYSYDRLDNAGVPSARDLVPALQSISVGERIPWIPSGEGPWFVVVRVEPARTLVLRATMAVPSARELDPARPDAPAYLDGSWTFHLEPRGSRGTRLLVRVRGIGHPRLPMRMFNALVFEPIHFMMQQRQLVNLKRRAEWRVARAQRLPSEAASQFGAPVPGAR